MPRPGPLPLNRPAMLALAMLVWLAWVPRAQASGCHVPERPVLGADAPAEGVGHAWAIGQVRPGAPPILKPLPCPGESPQRPAVSKIATAAACLVTASPPSEVPAAALRASEDLDRLDPHPARLDRPPRRSGSPA